ncbi:DUF2189 domain-containing protein [Inhella gelatinilytica]|uniref:DUF2189 domain-containing protein n=1 Tax=Inhella gelatinilytica TaxID=2795030 RepID=A0A931NE62_9BURK|nr:DUF2189 domain-containing protein [Inhella gelatinilytica]MBH9552935.1 DUF2189 domain-containing protein [Inhella gelatinilytica]
MSPALAQSLDIRLRPAHPAQIRHWLGRGWLDFCAYPVTGLFHGALMAIFGWLLLAVAHHQFWMLAGAFTGFLLVAPIAATGLYAISRARSRGQPTGLSMALALWKPNKPVLIGFGLLLSLAGTGWVLTSAALFTVLSPAPIQTPADFVRIVVLAPEGFLLELWMMMGALLAAPVYASSVISIPLLLDRRVGLWAAVLTSWRVVLAAPGTLTLWAGTLVLLSLLGMATLLAGLIVIGPWLAHASWHAYADLVDASALEERR